MEESVRNCSYCGAQTVTPYRCSGCGSYFCSRHRLPEQHDCVAIRKPTREKPSPRRGGLARLLAKVAVFLVALGAALYLLDMFGVVDLQDLVEYLQGFVAEFT